MSFFWPGNWPLYFIDNPIRKNNRMKKKYLLAPGPTQHHRTPQSSKIFGEAAESAKYLFQTKQDVLLLAATRTAGDIL
jgi:aspartate aminotransferase-like enzyme